MPVPFGFAFGDFVAAVGLFRDLGVALREHGGASDDYQHTLRELEALAAVLSQFERIGSNSSDVPQVNAIRGQASFTQHIVSTFLEKIEKFEPDLGTNSRPFKASIPKAKWMLFVSKEVADLRNLIQTQSVVLQFLLQLLNRDTLTDVGGGVLQLRTDVSKMHTAILAQQNETQRLSNDVRGSVVGAEASIRRDVQDALLQLKTQLGNLRLVIPEGPHPGSKEDKVRGDGGGQQEMQSSSNHIEGRVVSAKPSMESDVHDDLLLLKKELGNLSLVVAASSGPEEDKALEKRELTQSAATLLQSYSPATRGSLPADLLVIQADEGPSSEAVIRSPTFTAADVALRLATMLHLAVTALVAKLMLLSPHVIGFTNVLRSVPRLMPPSTDNIIFEDVLGRVQSLQYEQFKHWRVFLMMLECTFEGLPGDAHVAKGLFRFTNNELSSSYINTAHWHRHILPGKRVVMAAALDLLTCEEGRCPRCRTCANTIKAICTCAVCKLSFFRDATSRDASAGGGGLVQVPDEEEANRALQKEIEDLKAFRRVYVRELEVPEPTTPAKKDTAAETEEQPTYPRASGGWGKSRYVYCCHCGDGPNMTSHYHGCPMCGHAACRYCRTK